MPSVGSWIDDFTVTVGDTSIVSDLVTGISVNYSMDMASQLTIEILDRDYKLASNGYFDLRRPVTLESSRSRTSDEFEISAVTYGPSNVYGAGSARIEARSAAVQRMKRDKRQESFKQMSATEFASIMCERFGLTLFGESTNKVQNIVKSRSSQADESIWDVLSNLANEHQFVLFEANGTLFFCSQRFLIGKFGKLENGVMNALGTNPPGYPGDIVRSGTSGEAVEILQNYLGVVVDGKFGASTKTAVQAWQRSHGFPTSGELDYVQWKAFFASVGENYGYVPLSYPSVSAGATDFELLELPELRRSDDDPFDGDGSLSVAKPNGFLLRPGMTIGISTPTGIIDGAYLINDVDFDLNGPEPVRIGFRTPERVTAQ